MCVGLGRYVFICMFTCTVCVKFQLDANKSLPLSTFSLPVFKSLPERERKAKLDKACIFHDWCVIGDMRATWQASAFSD